MGTSLFDLMPDNGMPGSPSAIRQMMSLLQQPNEPVAQEGSSAIMPQGDYGQGHGGLLGPTPTFAAPQGKPGMIDRIMGRFRPKAPAGYEGLLSTEEIHGARPGLLQSLIGTPDAPSSSDRYRGNLNNIVAMKQMAGQIASQKQLQESRAAIAQRYPEKPNETPQETIARLRSMFAAAVGAGDTEMAGKLGEVVKALGGERGAGDDLEWIDMGGEKALVRKSTGEVIRREKKSPTARDPNAPDTAAQMREQRNFQREQQLSDDYNKDTKETREMAVKVAGAISEAPAAKQGDGVAQVNMLYAFVSSMDPGTAVREGEIGLVRSAGSLVQQAQGLLAKYADGQAVTVPPAMVEQMANLMRRRLEGSKKYVESRSKYYQNRARRWGVNADNFPVLEIDLPEPSAANTGGAVKNAIGGIR